MKTAHLPGSSRTQKLSTLILLVHVMWYDVVPSCQCCPWEARPAVARRPRGRLHTRGAARRGRIGHALVRLAAFLAGAVSTAVFISSLSTAHDVMLGRKRRCAAAARPRALSPADAPRSKASPLHTASPSIERRSGSPCTRSCIGDSLFCRFQLTCQGRQGVRFRGRAADMVFHQDFLGNFTGSPPVSNLGPALQPSHHSFPAIQTDQTIIRSKPSCHRTALAKRTFPVQLRIQVIDSLALSLVLYMALMTALVSAVFSCWVARAAESEMPVRTQSSDFPPPHTPFRDVEWGSRDEDDESIDDEEDFEWMTPYNVDSSTTHVATREEWDGEGDIGWSEQRRKIRH
ncbi:unnamed protein product [Diplocarpon coronariae]